MSPKCRDAGSIFCGSGWMLQASDSFPTGSPCGALIGLCEVSVVFSGRHNVRGPYASGNRKRKTASVCLPPRMLGQVFLFLRKKFNFTKGQLLHRRKKKTVEIISYVSYLKDSVGTGNVWELHFLLKTNSDYLI